jgi:DNA-binding Lrp family transcriptional regulator
MDLIDKKILTILQSDATISLSAIASRIVHAGFLYNN